MIDNHREYDVMAAVEADHWWYRVLHHLVIESIERRFESRNLNVLDAGCGTGGLMVSLKAAGYQNIKGFDFSPIAVDFCLKKGLDVQLGDLNDFATIQATSNFDVIVSNDTLYHLSHEQRHVFLGNAYKRLNKGGLLVMNLPALSAFRGTHDRAVGISHRFNRADVHELIRSKGFESLTMRYWPFGLAPVVFVIRTLQRFIHDPTGSVKPLSDLRTYNSVLNTLLLRLTLIETRLLKNTPFGSSLFTVFRRT